MTVSSDHNKAEPGGSGSGVTTLILWDVPTRIFHWGLVTCLLGSYISVESDDMELHETFGLTILRLVIFRILWGFVGSEPSRFATFVRGPGTALRYLSDVRAGRSKLYLTHNPLGAFAVVAMLAAVAVQAALGLFSSDDILFDGPLNSLVSYDMGQTLTGLHHQMFNVLLALIALHLIAIWSYAALLRTDLISPMLGGRKDVPADDAPAQPRQAPLWLAFVLAGVSAVIVYGITALG